MQNGGLVVGPSVIRAGEDGDDGLSRLEAFEDGLVASNDSHQIVLVAKGVGSVFGKLVVLPQGIHTHLVRK